MNTDIGGGVGACRGCSVGAVPDDDNWTRGQDGVGPRKNASRDGRGGQSHGILSAGTWEGTPARPRLQEASGVSKGGRGMNIGVTSDRRDSETVSRMQRGVPV